MEHIALGSTPLVVTEIHKVGVKFQDIYDVAPKKKSTQKERSIFQASSNFSGGLPEDDHAAS